MSGLIEHARSQATLIDIDKIHVLNPRARSQKSFRDLTANMVDVGMKRPITVTPNRSGGAGKDYDLICGQGRLEAFQASGRSQIWAFIIEADEEQALIMSLVENLARRQHRPLDILKAIEILRDQGYAGAAIARKTGLSSQYVSDVLVLISKGEERLLIAVEEGKIPTRLAAAIAQGSIEEQRALHEAYESGQLRGNKIIVAKKILDRRRTFGPQLERRIPGTSHRLTGTDVVKAFDAEMARKRLLIQKADSVNAKLIFVTEALRTLMQDENFANLLRAESLITVPKELANRINQRERHA